MEKSSTVSWCRKFKASIWRKKKGYLKAVEKKSNNWVYEGTKLPKIVRFTKIFKEAIWCSYNIL